MKTKFILMFISTLYSIHALALEGEGIKLLSETINLSPGTQGGFVASAIKARPNPLGFVSANSLAHDAEGSIYVNVFLWGNHSFYISNYTTQPQSYTYKYELRCDGRYAQKIDRIMVKPNGYGQDAANSYLYLSHSIPGVWPINVITEVTGESSGRQQSDAKLRVNK